MTVLQTSTVGEGVERATVDSAAIDKDRRIWIATTTVVAGTGLVATAVPFVASLAPSERARAQGAPVEVDLQGLQPGDVRTVEWRGKPVFVLRRTPDMLDALTRHDDLLADPLSRRSEQPAATRHAMRSMRPELVVLEAVCTNLGCIPSFRPVRARLTSVRHGPGASTALATDRSSTLPGASSRTYRRRPTHGAAIPIRFRYDAAHRRRCEDLIFQRPGEPTMQTFNFDVSGMTCGGCTGSVQRTLSKIDGVSHADVTLRPGVASVVADPDRVTSAQIESAIHKLGYTAKVRAMPVGETAPRA
jgi:ubiquinol-cytochrome c reductase iron-sulfur subunit